MSRYSMFNGLILLLGPLTCVAAVCLPAELPAQRRLAQQAQKEIKFKVYLPTSAELRAAYCVDRAEERRARWLASRQSAPVAD